MDKAKGAGSSVGGRDGLGGVGNGRMKRETTVPEQQ